MKIALVGDFSPNQNEGLKNIAWNYYKFLIENKHKVLKIDIGKASGLRNVFKIVNNKPDIVHYIPGPTNISILIIKLMNIISSKKTKFIIFTPHPKFNEILFKLIKPRIDLALLQNIDLKNFFTEQKIMNEFFPISVDTTRFKPVNLKTKLIIRHELGIPESEIVLLHVGHLIKARNLKKFKKISNKFHIIILASEYIGVDKKIRDNLVEWGCDVRIGYFPDIERFYQASDIYIFPVDPGNTISIPLSIIEAIYCGLPVITKKFKDLEYYIENDVGKIHFSSFKNKEDLEKLIIDLSKNETISKDINKILENDLEYFYSMLLKG